MIFRASEPASPRGEKPNREIILALLAMSFLVAVMIRYSRSLWCERVPLLCLRDNVADQSVIPDDDGLDASRPGAVRPGSEGLSGPGATGSEPEAIDAFLPDDPSDIEPFVPGANVSTQPLPTARRQSPTAQRSLPDTATPRARPSATTLATRASASGNGDDSGEATPTPSTSPGGASASATPSATQEDSSGSGSGSGDDEPYPNPQTTRFPTRTPSPTPEGYPGP